MNQQCLQVVTFTCFSKHSFKNYVSFKILQYTYFFRKLNQIKYL